ncbi:MAG: FIST C-terminal domain-containing protein [Candidatus Accumulibacter sp. UW26]|jgi:hypothetical protein
MNVASALLAGNDARPGLAVAALSQALEKIGQRPANGVLLFLSAEFARQAQLTVTAVARAARCTQVVGGIAAGVFTHRGWVLDRPAVALMVFADDLSLTFGETGEPRMGPILSYSGSRFPPAWAMDRTRFGGCFAGQAEPVAWQNSRLREECSVQVRGGEVEVGVSLAWRFLGEGHTVDCSRAHELIRVGGKPAFDSLMADLAGHCDPPPSLTVLAAVLIDADAAAIASELLKAGQRPVAIVERRADGSLILAEHMRVGQRLAWAMRSPSAARADMRRCVARLAEAAPEPVAALLFSCIGRGPCFHDGEDCEVDCLRERFPELPLIGCYGTGQIAPSPVAGNQLLQNAVVTALISPLTRRSDVQPEP